MKPLVLFSLICCIASVEQINLGAEASWTAPLAQMPLVAAPAHLTRTNCVEIMLKAFRSNGVVKALIFMPGATDEFYMFRRAKADLTNPAPSLLEAICALTNQSLIRATFQAPLLLLHTDEDSLEPDISVGDTRTLDRLRARRVPGPVMFNDRDWDFVQPLLKWSLKVDVRPWQQSRDSWHFYRHNFAAWDLTGWEALESTALAGKTRVNVSRNKVVFEPDPRVRNVMPAPSRHPARGARQSPAQLRRSPV
jgi:hypothetical protein